MPDGEKEDPMKWNSTFSIGIEAIDRQHQQIFEHLLAIEDSIAKRDSWHILHCFLTRLADFVKFHLAVEEALLEIIGYPDLAHHRDMHARLLEQIGELEDQLRKQGPAERLVMGFFESWFVRHVLSTDREYAAYVRKEFPALVARRSA